MIRESYRFGFWLRSKIIDFNKLKSIIKNYFSRNKISKVEIIHKVESVRGVSHDFKNIIPIDKISRTKIFNILENEIILSFGDNVLKLKDESNILSDLINNRIYLLDSNVVIIFHKE